MRFTSSNPSVTCNCEEIEGLRQLSNAFGQALFEKLVEKLERSGFGGWDSPEFNEPEIVKRILEHLPLRGQIHDQLDTDTDEVIAVQMSEPGVEPWDPIDVAAFAAFAWNRRQL